MPVHGFRGKVKEDLRRSVGDCCSAPNCGLKTSVYDPQTRRTKTTGDAAHICGARGGAPRFKDLPEGMGRHSFENGIWLCAVCHRMIDNSEGLFPAEELWRWKALAEGAYRASERGRPGSLVIGVDIGAERQKASDFLKEIHPVVDLVWDDVRAVAENDQVHCWRTLNRQIRFLLGRRAGASFSKAWDSRHPHWTYTPELHAWQNEIVRQAQALVQMPGLRAQDEAQIDMFYFWDEELKEHHFRNPTLKELQTFCGMLNRFEEFLRDYKGPIHARW